MNKKFTLIFLMAFLLVLPSSAQDVSVTGGNRCSIAQRDDVSGDKISVYFDETELRSVLVVLHDLVGCTFIVGESVSPTLKVASFTAIDQPWNVVLSDFLKAHGLGVKIASSSNPHIIITTVEEIERGTIGCGVRKGTPEDELVTDFLQLKYLSTCGGNVPCDQMIKDAAMVEELIKRRLSRRGSVEFDSRTRVLVVTDTRIVVDGARALVNYVDTPEFYNQFINDK